jgi:hypothetical protein
MLDLEKIDGEGAPDQFSEIAVLMGDEPEVSDIIPSDHRSGDELCYHLLLTYGTDGCTLQKRLHTVNILERQDGEVFYFERSEVQYSLEAPSTGSHPKTFTITGLCLAMESPEAIICSHSAVFIKSFWWFSTRRTWYAILSF